MTFAPRKGRTHLAAVSLAGLSLAALSLAALALTAAPARAQAPLKIGVLSDFSSVYSDIGGQGNLEATKLAVEEFGGTMFGKPIEVISADPQNKADIAASIAQGEAAAAPTPRPAARGARSRCASSPAPRPLKDAARP